jgi:hypothetical protein
MSGITRSFIEIVLLDWLAGRAPKEARSHSSRRVLDYGRAGRIVGWCFALFGILSLYGATRASKDQIIIATCAGGGMFIVCMALFAEFHFVRIEFDEFSLYTFSPWRERRVIPWSDVIGYAYSDMNRWHILKTSRSGSIRLSILLSGLGTMAEELKKRKIHG